MKFTLHSHTTQHYRVTPKQSTHLHFIVCQQLCKLRQHLLQCGTVAQYARQHRQLLGSGYAHLQLLTALQDQT